nr:TetR/AcrR family transcriptional regulator [Plastoroseomonas hellenica]
MRDAAEAVFLRDGYAAATMDEVARRAGMSKRTLYQVFPSKAALFVAVLEDYAAPMHIDVAIEAEPDVGKALTALLLAVARQLLTPRANGIFRLILAEMPRSPDLAGAFHRAKLGRGASSLERRIEAEMTKGRLRGTDPKVAADMLFSMVVTSLAIEVMLGLRDTPDDAEITGRVREAVEIFLRGAAAGGPSGG